MEHYLNIEIQKLSFWLKANILSLNIKKTCTMTFSNIPCVRNKINNLYIDETQIDTISHSQYLGVIGMNINYTCNNIQECRHILECHKQSEQNNFD